MRKAPRPDNMRRGPSQSHQAPGGRVCEASCEWVCALRVPVGEGAIVLVQCAGSVAAWLVCEWPRESPSWPG